MANTLETYTDSAVMKALLTRDSSGIGNEFIDDAVTTLRPFAFAGFTDLDKVSLPSVTEIGGSAFLEAEVAETFEMDWANITKIGPGAFAESDVIKSSSLTLASLTSLGIGAFYGEPNVTSLTLPIWTGTSEYAGEQLPSTRISSASGFFPGSAIQSLSLPAITYLSISMCRDCESLVTVNAPLATGIGNYAFQGCKALTTLTLDSSFSSVGQGAFTGCVALASFTGENVTNLGGTAFNGCTSLTTVSFPLIQSLAAGTFSGCSALQTANLPLVKTVGSSAFQNCTKLSSLNIKFSELTQLPDNVFAGCSSLTGTFAFTAVSSVGTTALNGCAMTKISFPALSALSSANCFQGCLAQEISIPLVTSIAVRNAFSGCTNLQTLSLPALASITGTAAFNGCTSLETLSLPELTTINVSGSTTSYATFSGCTSLKTVSLPKLATLTNPYAFVNCKNLETVVIGGAITAFPTMAFQNCSKLKTLVLSGITSVPSFGTNMFNGATLMLAKTGVVYVPADLVDSFKAQTYWKNYTIDDVANYTAA